MQTVPSVAPDSVRPEDVYDETTAESEMGRQNRSNGLPGPTRKETHAEEDEAGYLVEGTGVVTILEPCMPKGVIDGLYFFDKSSAPPEIQRGSKVNFRAKKTDCSLQWEVLCMKLFVTREEMEKKEFRKTQTIVGFIEEMFDGQVYLRYGSTVEEVQKIPLKALKLGYPPWLGKLFK